MSGSQAVTALVFDASDAAAGAAQFDAAGRRIIAANQAVATATTRTVDAIGNSERALARLTERFDPAYRAQQIFAREAEKATRILDASGAAETRRAQILAAVADRYDPLIRAERERARAAEDASREATRADEAAAEAKRRAVASQLADLARLRAAIDPLYAANQRAAEAVETLDQAFRRGQIGAADYSRSVALVGQQRDRAVAQADGSAAAARAAAAAVEQEAAAFTRLRVALDPAFASQQRAAAAAGALAQQQDVLNAALARGAVSQAEHARLVAAATAAHQRSTLGVADFAVANDNAGASARRLGQFAGQAGFQVQDFTVQVAGGQNALVAFAQQGSQLLGFLGPAGAIAGAALAIAAVTANFLLGRDAADLMRESLERQAASFQAVEQEAQRLRDGLATEARQVRELATYYDTLTDARRSQELRQFTRDQQDLIATQDRLRDSALGVTAALSQQFQQQIFDAEQGAARDYGRGSPEYAAIVSNPDLERMRQFVALVEGFRETGDVSREALARLYQGMLGLADGSDIVSERLRRQATELDKLTGTAGEVEAAQTQLELRARALGLGIDTATAASERLRRALDALKSYDARIADGIGQEIGDLQRQVNAATRGADALRLEQADIAREARLRDLLADRAKELERLGITGQDAADSMAAFRAENDANLRQAQRLTEQLRQQEEGFRSVTRAARQTVEAYGDVRSTSPSGLEILGAADQRAITEIQRALRNSEIDPAVRERSMQRALQDASREAERLDRQFDSLTNDFGRSLTQTTFAALEEGAGRGQSVFASLASGFGSILRQSVAQALNVSLVTPGIRSLASGIGFTGADGGQGSLLGSLGNYTGLSGLLPNGGILGGVNSLGVSSGLFGNGITALSQGPTLSGATLDSTAVSGLFGSASLSSVLGGAGLGFGAGTLLNSVLGGNSAGGMVGSGAGALAGSLAAAGGFLGPLGVLGGGLLGGALGGGLGGLLGGGAANNAYGFTLSAQDGQLAASGLSTTGNGNGGAEVLAQAQQAIAAANAVIAAAGVTVQDNRRAITGTNSADQSASLADALRYFSFGATNDNRLDTVLQGRQFDSVEALAGLIQEVQALGAAVDAIADPVSAFQQQVNALQTSFDASIQSAQRLGFGEAELTAERAKQVAALIAQRDTQVAVSRAEIAENLLRAQGRTAQADAAQSQREVNAAIEAYRTNLKDMGLTLAETAPHVAALTEQLVAQQQATAAALRQQQREAIDALDLLSRQATAALSGNAGDQLAADLFAADSRAASAVSELEAQLKALGFAAADITPRVRQLIRAQQDQRQAIIAEYQARRDAAAQALDDRLFAATTDTSTQDGALAALERSQARERVEAARIGLADLTALEATQAAERAAVVKRFADQERQAILSAGGSIRSYIDGLRSGAGGGASPEDRFSAAQDVFGRDLTLARGGDRDALARITQSADTLLQSGQAMFASGGQFQALRDMVLSSLESLPAVKSYDQLIYEELASLGGSIQVEVALAAELKLRADIDAALALIDTSAATPRAKAEAEAALSQLRGVVDAILVPGAVTSAAFAAAAGAMSAITGALAAIAVAPGVTDAVRSEATARLQTITAAVSALTLAPEIPDTVRVSASRALEAITGAVASIALAPGVTDATRAAANAALDDILGRVSAISLDAAIPAGVRERANAVLATIAGNVASIALAPGVTDAVRAAAIARLATITGAVSSISMAAAVPEAVRVSASTALEAISGAVTAIALAPGVTDATRAAANAALDDILGRVSAISLDAAIPAGVRERANAALATIAGNVASIALAPGVTDAVRAAAIARLANITGAVSSISMAAAVPEAVRVSASTALASISGAVSSIAVAPGVTDVTRAKANDALDTIVGRVSAITMAAAVPEAVRLTANAALASLAGNVASIALATGVTDAVRAAAIARLASITGAVSSITLDPAVPAAAKDSATKALSTIGGVVSQIAVWNSVTNAARAAANEALNDIVGVVSKINVWNSVTSAARVAANDALGNIAGNVGSISLAPGVTDAVRTAAIARLASITGAVSSITMAPSVPEAVQIAANSALASISGAVTSIAIAPGVTNATRLAANDALDTIVGVVSRLSMDAAIPAGVRERASAALATIAGNVSSIALATGVTDAVRAAAIAHLATITGAVSSISMAAAVPEAVRVSASTALASISGVVSSIAIAPGVTNATRLAANDALDTIVGVVSRLSMDAAIPAGVRERANAALSAIAGNVASIALATGVTEEVRAAAIARLASITGAVSSITMAPSVPAAAKDSATKALSTIGGVVSQIAVWNSVTNAARAAANEALDDIVGVVSKINVWNSVTSAARVAANDALGNIAGSISEIVLAPGATDQVKQALLRDVGSITSVLKVASDISGIPADQLDVLFSASEVITRAIALQATGGTLTAGQRDILRAEAGKFDRVLNSILGGATSLTADQRAILTAASGTVDRILRNQVETTETVSISRSIDDKIGAALATLNYSVAQQLSYLHNLGDVRTYLFHLREAARGAGGGLRVTTLQASGALNDGFAVGGSELANAPSWGGNYGGLLANALGNAMAHARLIPFALGGLPEVVSAPTIAPMALFGEAGPEAIMPLRRGRDGRLGVEVVGASSYQANDNRAVVAELQAARRELAQMRQELAAIRQGQDGQTQVIAASGDQNMAGQRDMARMLAEMRASERLARARPA
ncbi:hypothetical protein [Falsiroseomonas selenitidurans]|uniref:Bacteriophage tail tape measure N-terminal domain-containing protein n=1 Tax=Falsiroseomonas selenitidurans TaxID=2716335 RepID=A0ABX1DZ99_9PROT|nr:hypothetical protein [Falsiroseomonas selenitidurans]NKC30206.1 hypothetical protein [Falsiroseomonas selenitidurans]